MRYQTVFLDRDGVINRRLPDDYVKSWEEFEFLPGVLDALKLLTDSGSRLIVITNQRGIATGKMTLEDLSHIHHRLRLTVMESNARLDAIYFCPHDKGVCDCRKPGIGMLLQAQKDFPEIDFSASVMVGDSLSDVEAGSRAGCDTVLIGSDPAYKCADSLLEAVYSYLT